ncbi:hypothetical protein C5167_009169 [Papaver somniferum]|uniref:Uncharacterized protein n=1 Tax=Papaver somniferum TaxID=3469 RepID=A0A4Y7JWK5_PAPSO|nr:hypothetical protein C5167_009169 [Papaver somniferum]
MQDYNSAPSVGAMYNMYAAALTDPDCQTWKPAPALCFGVHTCKAGVLVHLKND